MNDKTINKHKFNEAKLNKNVKNRSTLKLVFLNNKTIRR